MRKIAYIVGVLLVGCAQHADGPVTASERTEFRNATAMNRAACVVELRARPNASVGEITRFCDCLWSEFAERLDGATLRGVLALPRSGLYELPIGGTGPLAEGFQRVLPAAMKVCEAPR